MLTHTHAGTDLSAARTSRRDRLCALHGADSAQAMPLALVALGIGVILVTVFILSINVYLKVAGASTGNLLDYYAADAGVERALAPLAADANAYRASSTLALNLNNRSVSVAIAPLGSQILPDPVGAMTATVTSYLITSRAGEIAIKARAEARWTAGQPAASVRLAAWQVGE